MATQKYPVEHRFLASYVPCGSRGPLFSNYIQVSRQLPYRKLYFGFAAHWSGLVCFSGQIQFKVENEVVFSLPFDYAEPQPGSNPQLCTISTIPDFRMTRFSLGTELSFQPVTNDNLAYISIRRGSTTLGPYPPSCAIIEMNPNSYVTDIDQVAIELSRVTTTDYSPSRLAKTTDFDVPGVDYYLGMTSGMQSF